MSWFNNLSDTFGTLMEVVAPMPVEQEKLEGNSESAGGQKEKHGGCGRRLVAQQQ